MITLLVPDFIFSALAKNHSTEPQENKSYNSMGCFILLRQRCHKNISDAESNITCCEYVFCNYLETLLNTSEFKLFQAIGNYVHIIQLSFSIIVCVITTIIKVASTVFNLFSESKQVSRYFRVTENTVQRVCNLIQIAIMRSWYSTEFWLFPAPSDCAWYQPRANIFGLYFCLSLLLVCSFSMAFHRSCQHIFINMSSTYCQKPE